MRKAAWITLATMLPTPLVAACGGNGDTGAAERKAMTGSFVGTVAGSDAYAAVVVGPDGDALAHVTDGGYSVDWLAGTFAGRTATLRNEGGATLEARVERRGVTGSFTRPQAATLQFTAQPTEAPAGLYRATQDFADGRYVGGWVVLPDRTERGTVRRYETPLIPGEVDPTTFTPGDATFAVPGGVLRPELVRPSSSLALPN
jgi:hypothetical protein